MTAFAGDEFTTAEFVFTWEVRSVNHRFLDISLRLPDMFRFLEPEIRATISSYVKRGKLDCTLTCKKAEHLDAEIRINHGAVRALLAAANEIEAAMSKSVGFSALDVLCWPGIREEPGADMENLKTSTIASLQQALTKLLEAREREGAGMAQMIEERCQGVLSQVAIARGRIPEVLEKLRQKLRARLLELVQEPEFDRLEQELVYFAQKLDVDEELDRLDTHTREVARLLTEKAPVGRRLDFLLQEMNREANTVGSKSADAVMTRVSVDLKVLIEQMREQVQNIE
ncbi:MAG: YicC/YloC family endoribonuclease [Pseudomonadota bacterium]